MKKILCMIFSISAISLLIVFLPQVISGQASLSMTLFTLISLPYGAYLFGYYALYEKLPFKNHKPEEHK